MALAVVGLLIRLYTGSQKRSDPPPRSPITDVLVSSKPGSDVDIPSPEPAARGASVIAQVASRQSDAVPAVSTQDGRMAVATGFQVPARRSPDRIAPSTQPTNLESPGSTGMSSTPQSDAPRRASIWAPFINSEGMVFVPFDSSSDSKLLICVVPTRVDAYADYARAAGGADSKWRSSGLQGAGESAVGFVNWHDAKQFCEWLTRTELEKGRLPVGSRYRLPTNAEWQRAFKSRDLLKLREMTGGKWQWCEDSSGRANRVLRGGNRSNGDTQGEEPPSTRLVGYGFRVVLEVPHD